MELYKYDWVKEQCDKLNKLAEKMYKEADVIAAIACLLGELAKTNNELYFVHLQNCRQLLRGKGSILDEIERELDETVNYSPKMPIYAWKD